MRRAQPGLPHEAHTSSCHMRRTRQAAMWGAHAKLQRRAHRSSCKAIKTSLGQAMWLRVRAQEQWAQALLSWRFPGAPLEPDAVAALSAGRPGASRTLAQVRMHVQAYASAHGAGGLAHAGASRTLAQVRMYARGRGCVARAGMCARSGLWACACGPGASHFLNDYSLNESSLCGVPGTLVIYAAYLANPVWGFWNPGHTRSVFGKPCVGLLEPWAYTQRIRQALC